MSNLGRRIEQAEQALSMGQEPLTVNIVYFGGRPLPAEERHGNITVRHVAYESVRERLEGANE